LHTQCIRYSVTAPLQAFKINKTSKNLYTEYAFWPYYKKWINTWISYVTKIVLRKMMFFYKSSSPFHSRVRIPRSPHQGVGRWGWFSWSRTSCSPCYSHVHAAAAGNAWQCILECICIHLVEDLVQYSLH